MPLTHATLTLVFLGALATGSGCSPGWSQIPRPAPAKLSPDQALQVWRGPNPITIRNVTVGADSVSGSPMDRYPRCDSCRVAIAQSEIDSFRIKPTDSNNNFGAGMTIGLVAGCVIMLLVIKAALGT